MLENAVPVILSHGGSIQPAQYPLQKAEEEDVLRFQLELGANSKVPPIFEVVNKEVDAPKNDRSILGLVKNMDSDYQQVLSNMKQLRRSTTDLEFKAFKPLGTKDEVVRTQYSSNITGGDSVRTSSDIHNDDRSIYKELLADQKENQRKTIEMMHDFSNKTISHLMLMSHIKVIGTAVTQVSQGFKTLFRSSG